MQAYFYDLIDALTGSLTGEEILLTSLDAEQSDFVRLNRNRVRQAGNVLRRSLSLDLIEGARHAAARIELTGEPEADLARLRSLLLELRSQRAHLPEDPHLDYATEVHSTEHHHRNTLPAPAEALDQVIDAAEGLDLVGIWASGVMHSGFANSLGQRNWHSSATFNLDWSCYHAEDKAVKSGYAGFDWKPERLLGKMREAREGLEIMARAPVTLEPGRYRAYLAPAALQEILGMMAWGGFGLKSHRTGQSPLLKMISEGRRLSPAVSLAEDHDRGLAPRFTSSGYIKPERVTLIEQGAYRDCLVDPRSAREYGESVNAESESPVALDMAAGDLERDRVLAELDTGLYLNNLWYLNFSDRSDCRITGMTRFACLWVEDGEVRAPVNVMRFDDSVLELLGERLLGLTAERELIFDASTYGRRSDHSVQLPGALVDGLTLTL
jgi:predicted Zn-dependent protease